MSGYLRRSTRIEELFRRVRRQRYDEHQMKMLDGERWHEWGRKLRLGGTLAGIALEPVEAPQREVRRYN
jgi:hypothetical protein